MSALQLSPRQRRARIAGYTGWIGLIVLQPVWHLWLAPDRTCRWPRCWCSPCCPCCCRCWPCVDRRARCCGPASWRCSTSPTAWPRPGLPAERFPAIIQIALSLLLILALGAGVQRRGRPDPAGGAGPGL